MSSPLEPLKPSKEQKSYLKLDSNTSQKWKTLNYFANENETHRDTINEDKNAYRYSEFVYRYI